MATKITILGSEPTEKKELKKIEFVKNLKNDMIIGSLCANPCGWENIVLLEKSSRYDGLDVMWAYDNGGKGYLYLGHFNDGVV